MLNDYIIDPLSNSDMIGKKHLSGRTKEECSLAFIAQKYEERDTGNDKTSAENVIHINNWRDNSLSSKLESKLVNLEYKYVNLKHSLGK